MDPQQAVVRATWEEQVAERLSTLDLEDGLRATGVDGVEADEDGNPLPRSAADD